MAQIASAIEEVARNAGSVLAKAAMALELENRPEQDELLDVLKNMPRFDLGDLEFEVAPSAVASLLGRRWSAARVERRIRSQAGNRIADAVGIYARVLQAWVRKTFTELQEQFDSYAGAYRAHLDRLAANYTGVEGEQAQSVGQTPDDCPPDFEFPSTLPRFDAGLFLPRDDPDWFGRSSYPPRILLLKGRALHMISHPSAGEPPRRWDLDQISSVESGHMLLKGWLRFAGPGFDCTVRYNTRGFPPVFRFMQSFRDQLLRGPSGAGPWPATAASVELPEASEVPLLASLDIKFTNALARELDTGEIVVMQIF